jgi:hypothetical protein
MFPALALTGFIFISTPVRRFIEVRFQAPTDSSDKLLRVGF